MIGLNAVEAVVRHRFEDVIRLYLTEERVERLAPVLRSCARTRRAYHIVPPDEIERIADSVHHEGVCALVKERAARDLPALLRGLPPPDALAGPLILLEDVRNPHNLGAILRVGAQFGALALLLAGHASSPRLSPAIYRTAEGGAEVVELVALGPVRRAFGALRRAGFRIFGTSGHAERSLFAAALPGRAVFAFGAEGEGLSEALLEACDEVLMIPGTGAVESINVACATSVVLAEHWRRHRCSLPAIPRSSDSREA